jgi:membrane fusion protein, multidrug efflux system
VPVVAVQTVQGTESVLLVDGDNKVKQRTITTSSRQGENYVVSGGLKPGDRVIVQGQHKVRPGDKVDVLSAPVKVGE